MHKIFTFVWSLITFVVAQEALSVDGYTYREGSNQIIRIDIFEDLLWSDCKSFDPALKEFLNSHTEDGTQMTDYVQAVFHMFPLPYHHNSFFVTQLVPFVYDINKKNEDVFRYTEFILKNQKEFLSRASNLTEPEVQQKICKLASKELGMFTFEEWLEAFKNRDYKVNAVLQWKYSAHQGIDATPLVFYNGLEVDTPTTLQEWQNLVKHDIPRTHRYVYSHNLYNGW